MTASVGKKEEELLQERQLLNNKEHLTCFLKMEFLDQNDHQWKYKEWEKNNIRYILTKFLKFNCYQKQKSKIKKNSEAFLRTEEENLSK